LDRLEKALADLGPLTPTDEAAVTATTLASREANARKIAECGERNEKRGPLCKQREAEAAEAANKVANTAASKATTDRANDIESQIARVRDALAKSANVTSVNPQAKVLSEIIPWANGGAAIASKMQAIIALVFELCIVGLMIGFETLGHVSANVAEANNGDPMREPISFDLPTPEKPKLITSNPVPAGSVPRVLSANLERATGKRADLADLAGCYRRTCRQENKRMVSQDEFLEAVDKFCKATDVKIRTIDGRVYLMDVRLIEQTNAAAGG
jgi:hypothetical protein